MTLKPLPKLFFDLNLNSFAGEMDETLSFLKKETKAWPAIQF